MAFGIDDAIGVGLSIINKFIPDKNEAAKAEAEYRNALLNIEAQQALAQTEVNKIEASNTNIFVSGWRPFVGWTCGIAFAYHYILQPVILLICAISGRAVVQPEFDMYTLINVLFGLLGLSAMRTYEKKVNK